MTEENNQRALFENAYREKCGQFLQGNLFERLGDSYERLSVRGAWIGWQLRARVAATEPPREALERVRAYLEALAKSHPLVNKEVIHDLNGFQLLAADVAALAADQKGEV